MQALQRELAERLSVETADHALQRVLRDDDLSRLGDAALEARRNVDRAAQDRVVDAFLRADVADNGRAAVDPDANLDDRQSDFLALVVPFADEPLQHDARQHGAIGVIILLDRCAEEGHHGVADEFVERAAIREDRFHRATEKVR